MEKELIDRARDKYMMGSIPLEIKSNTEELKARGKKYDIRLKKTMNKMFARQEAELKKYLDYQIQALSPGEAPVISPKTERLPQPS